MPRPQWQTERRAKPDLAYGNPPVSGASAAAAATTSTVEATRRQASARASLVDVIDDDSSEDEEGRPGAYAISREGVGDVLDWDPTVHTGAAASGEAIAGVAGTETAWAETTESDAETSEEETEDMPTSRTRKKALKERKWLIILGVVILAAVLFGCVAAFVVTAQKVNGEEKTSIISSSEKCDYADQETQVDPFLQCGCFQRITKVIDSVENAYNSLKSFGQLAGSLDDDIPIESCAPENMALLWVASEIVEAEEEGRVIPFETILNRFVLVFLYSAWSGKEWDIKANWLSQSSECVWYGVGYGAAGEIVSLSLRQNNVQGPLESRLGLLQDLVTLDLGGNKLNGPIPLEVLSLPSLGE